MPIPGSSIDVPCSLFSGLNTELSPSDLPEGVSPSNQDVAFLPGSVFTRPGAHRLFTTVNPLPGNSLSGVQYFKTFSPDGGALVRDNGVGGLPAGAAVGPQTILLDGNGYWWQELVDSAPGVLNQQWQIVPVGTSVQSSSGFNREFFSFSDGVHGLVRPLAIDQSGSWRRVSQDGPAVAPTVADSATAGNVAAGVHQCVVMFLTDTGYLTAPSPPVSWTAAGGKKVALSNIPIGPSNIIARVFAFTGAGGDNFFTILQNVTYPSAVSALVVFDNTSTTATLGFTDTTLFDATAIDIPGNNQFALVPVSPCLGFFYYANRLFAWGELNRVTNLRNMAFGGGTAAPNGSTPLGWTVVTAGGSLSRYGTIPTDLFWVISGDGTNNPKGQITQSVYRDAFGISILQPSESYSFYCVAGRGNVDVTGNLIADIYSATGGGQLAQAIIALNRLPIVNIGSGGVAAQASLVSQPFNNAMPATIPSDAVLRVYTQGTAGVQQVAIAEMSVVSAAQPYRLVARGSYVNNPESFDSVTGDIGPSSDNTPIQELFSIRDNLYILTSEKLHETTDDSSFEPSGWTIRQVADKCGSFGPRASSGGEDWRIWAGPTGLRIFEGQFPWKVSQEIQTKWDQINPLGWAGIWVKNDSIARRCYIGVPVNQTTPDQIYVLDYRELDTAYEIGKGDTIHISFTGKMIASDLARKWTVWNLAANHADIVQRFGNTSHFCIGGPYGNIHYFDAAKLTDDDYGQIASFYVTYFFINHEAEMQLGVGSHRKLYTYLTAYVSGTGNLLVTPLTDSIFISASPTLSYQLPFSAGNDLEWMLNVTAERVAFKFQSFPVTGTDNGFNLQKMVVKLREDPWMPVRGAI